MGWFNNQLVIGMRCEKLGVQSINDRVKLAEAHDTCRGAQLFQRNNCQLEEPRESESLTLRHTKKTRKKKNEELGSSTKNMSLTNFCEKKKIIEFKKFAQLFQVPAVSWLKSRFYPPKATSISKDLAFLVIPRKAPAGCKAVSFFLGVQIYRHPL